MPPSSSPNEILASSRQLAHDALAASIIPALYAPSAVEAASYDGLVCRAEHCCAALLRLKEQGVHYGERARLVQAGRGLVEEPELRGPQKEEPCQRCALPLTAREGTELRSQVFVQASLGQCRKQA